MGICLSSNGFEQERNKQAEQVMKEAKRTLINHTKVLLLGTGDSGKSTILKQMRVINALPFSTEEVEHYRQVIFTNLITSMRIVHGILNEEGIDCSEDIKALFNSIDQAPEISPSQPYPTQYLKALQELWDDSDVQKAVLIAKQFALPDNSTYYFQHLPRLFDAEYSPTPQDIIHARVRTTGIQETRFIYGKRTVSIIDVGGQKSERRKWIHCFQQVTAIMFLVSLSGYDQTLSEDWETNQMQDAMIVWESICSSPWFERTSFILFLNKEDLFKERITHSPIKRYFPDYDGRENSVKDGEEYFKRRFLHLHKKGLQTLTNSANSPGRPKIPVNVNQTEVRTVYPYFTTATDTNVIRNVMSSVNDIILIDNLTASAFL